MSSRWSTGGRWPTSSTWCCGPAGRRPSSVPSAATGPRSRRSSARCGWPVVRRPCWSWHRRRRRPTGSCGPGGKRTWSTRRSSHCFRRRCRCCPTCGCPAVTHRATSVHAAGGDWYDAVPLGSGRLALVVGDAVGHGVSAAGAMSRLRGAMRSTALRDPSPQSVLAAMDQFAAQMDDVDGASVFYGLLEVTTGLLRYVAAGHPAPLVVSGDGITSVLPLVPRPPLGSPPDTPVGVAEYTLAQGATLVLFSNGAVTGALAPDEALRRLADVSRDVLAV